MNGDFNNLGSNLNNNINYRQAPSGGGGISGWLSRMTGLGPKQTNILMLVIAVALILVAFLLGFGGNDGLDRLSPDEFNERYGDLRQ